MVDAEQSYLQPAIRRIVLQAMKRYNRDMAIIFNTYQCYLKVGVRDFRFCSRDNTTKALLFEI